MTSDTYIKVLVIDDDEVDRMTIRRALRKTQLSVFADDACDGSEALQRLLEEKFDCILLDYNLPGLNAG